MNHSWGLALHLLICHYNPKVIDPASQFHFPSWTNWTFTGQMLEVLWIWSVSLHRAKTWKAARVRGSMKAFTPQPHEPQGLRVSCYWTSWTMSSVGLQLDHTETERLGETDWTRKWVLSLWTKGKQKGEDLKTTDWTKGENGLHRFNGPIMDCWLVTHLFFSLKHQWEPVRLFWQMDEWGNDVSHRINACL